ncbi:hypothetical protein KSF_077100 [Reticulibacter mediterranei]|uniref:ADP ribosyltransferase domain-containing protein n=1 Tax=Reticulibacter mediterranei TaxID=2778369 RepID=A0A8J3IVR1_9CHLR|nr:ADP-ribosyltransferase [Reticulibacter mediterranei]GHO97662.1 hypothetical protein KSF_077100 [Reticulibacter mediterranei]
MPGSKKGLDSKTDSPPPKEIPSDAPQKSSDQLNLFQEFGLHEQERKRQEWSKWLKMEVIERKLWKSPLSPNEQEVFNQYVDARMRISSEYQKAIPGQFERISNYQGLENASPEEIAAIEYHSSMKWGHMAAFARADAKKMREEMAKGKTFDEVFDPALEQVGNTARIARELMDDPELFEEVASHVEHMDNVTRRMKLPEQVIAKTDLSEEEFGTFLFNERGERQDINTIQPGEQRGLLWVDPWFVATSLRHGHIYTSVYGPDAKTVRMYITLPKDSSGAYIRDASRNPSEDEATLPLKTITQLDRIIHIDKSELTAEERKRLQFIPTYVVQATRVEGEWRF